MQKLIFAVMFICAGVAPHLAHACRFESVPLAQSLESAAKAFIGTVTTVENGMAYITVEQAVKGVKAGETVEAEYHGNSCEIRFQPGQRWFYLGPKYPSGSLLLQDENGNEIAQNMKAVEDKLGAPVARGGMQVGGTVEVSCAPWDGAAYMITLDNGVTATVYDSIASLEAKDAKTTMVFQADGKPERGHGQIVTCPKAPADKPSSLPCQSQTGTITMGGADKDRAYGRIDITDGEHSTRHVFRVKRVHKQVFCG